MATFSLRSFVHWVAFAPGLQTDLGGRIVYPNVGRNLNAGRSSIRRLVAATLVVALAVLGSTPAVVAQDMDDSDSGFSDVSEGNFHKADIDALNEQGLLEGTECAEGMFCPGDPMKRWTMAVWLVRALDDAEPAAVEESSFDDVDSDNQWLPHVERLAELEVTKGCGTEPLIFCPRRYGDPCTDGHVPGSGFQSRGCLLGRVH